MKATWENPMNLINREKAETKLEILEDYKANLSIYSGPLGISLIVVIVCLQWSLNGG